MHKSTEKGDLHYSCENRISTSSRYRLSLTMQVLNKIDLPGAEPERVCREIEEVGLCRAPENKSLTYSIFFQGFW